MFRMLALAGLLGLAGAPLAAASEAASRDADEERRVMEQPAQPAPAEAPARPSVAQREEAGTVRGEVRRRSGKRVPDAELIAPRGAL